ncbi:hypothetical protein OH76DRAFT_1407955 [Lentinus brumalis]|uniref:F-box domain-containing protein n=1 Tax=Lentinus brumalis TaxID=2498619 RepID=A0A371CZ57_9APHY|nr:hypothetical protein OH76DRAFT_1407955 [Polyporus brumalis]
MSRDRPICVIIRFAHKLPALRSLTINSDITIHSDMTIDSDLTITSLSLQAVLSTFPTLTSLTLGCVYVTHMLAFRMILAALPALRKLSLEDVKWWHHRGNDGFSSYSSDVYPIPPLTHLAWSRAEFWWDSLHAAKSAAVLTCLLRAVCQSIEYVSVEDLQGEIIEQAASHMSGSLVLPRLSTIKLLQVVDEPDNFDGMGYPIPKDDLTDVLRRQKSFLDTIMPAEHLRSVTIAFKYTHSASPAPSRSLNALLRGFEEISTDLEDSLTTPSLERLEAVEFELQEVRPSPNPSVESLHLLVTSLLSSMEATFPRLRARGLLDVKFVMAIGELMCTVPPSRTDQRPRTDALLGGDVPTHYRVDRGVLQATPIPEHDLHPFQ